MWHKPENTVPSGSDGIYVDDGHVGFFCSEVCCLRVFVFMFCLCSCCLCVLVFMLPMCDHVACMWLCSCCVCACVHVACVHVFMLCVCMCSCCVHVLVHDSVNIMYGNFCLTPLAPHLCHKKCVTLRVFSICATKCSTKVSHESENPGFLPHCSVLEGLSPHITLAIRRGEELTPSPTRGW